MPTLGFTPIAPCSTDLSTRPNIGSASSGFISLSCRKTSRIRVFGRRTKVLQDESRVAVDVIVLELKVVPLIPFVLAEAKVAGKVVLVMIWASSNETEETRHLSNRRLGWICGDGGVDGEQKHEAGDWSQRVDHGGAKRRRGREVCM